jgi:thiamine biosynthesis lipoprotein
MDTLVTIQVISSPGSEPLAERLERAFGWFREVEARCSRFDEKSEVMRLLDHVGNPIRVSSLLFSVVQFALALSSASDGAFDPTVGHTLESRGFNRNYRTGDVVTSQLASSAGCSYRDVCLDPRRQTITLLRPLILDLGAVAKGFAIDLAARELQPLDDFSISAGGDVYVGGRNPTGEPWHVGIRHPREPGDLLGVLEATDVAVCTSGDYVRASPSDSQHHHILDPRTGQSASAVASVTVVAPTAMLADGLATAAFVLGPIQGISLLEQHGVAGRIVSPALESVETRSLARYRGTIPSSVTPPAAT